MIKLESEVPAPESKEELRARAEAGRAAAEEARQNAEANRDDAEWARRATERGRVSVTPFLDLVFEGLPRLPGAGEEVVGRALHVVPGGTAVQAIGLARLGLSVALVSP